jgi:hypothetical protein
MDQSCITNGHTQLPQREKSKRLIHPHTLHETHRHTGSHLPTHTASHPKIIFTPTAVTIPSTTCDTYVATLLKIWRTTWRLRDLLGDRTLNEDPLQVLCNSQGNVEERHLPAAGVSNPTEQYDALCVHNCISSRTHVRSWLKGLKKYTRINTWLYKQRRPGQLSAYGKHKATFQSLTKEVHLILYFLYVKRTRY